MRVWWAALLLSALPAAGEKRVLYVTHSAGFVHGSIPFSERVLEREGARTGKLEVLSTQDLSWISAERLRDFDAVFFFTSGELALSAQQKSDLLEFVRNGKGFGGVHSATDTLYAWPEYGELIGAYFDGHPWAHEVVIDVEDPDHPAMRHLTPSFRIADEIYQFRNYSRDRVRPLMTLDARSVNLGLEGVNRTDQDFALAWTRQYGRGRVFYTALGHGDETWADPRFQKMLVEALLWLTFESDADGAARLATPKIEAAGNAAHRVAGASPGGLVVFTGEGLTTGSSLDAASTPLPIKLVGTSVKLNGVPLSLLRVAPGEILVQLPFDLEAGSVASLEIVSGARASEPRPLPIEPAAPGIFRLSVDSTAPGATITLWATGLGAVRVSATAGMPAALAPLAHTVAEPTVLMGGMNAAVQFSGLAPLQVGVYQINAVVPEGLLPGQVEVSVRVGERVSNPVALQIQ